VRERRAQAAGGHRRGGGAPAERAGGAWARRRGRSAGGPGPSGGRSGAGARALGRATVRAANSAAAHGSQRLGGAVQERGAHGRRSARASGASGAQACVAGERRSRGGLASMRRGRARAGSGGASKRVCAGGWRCVGAQKGRATRRSKCGTGSDAGEPEAERCQSRTRERLTRELMRRDVGELASVEHGSWSGMVQAVQELACWRAGVGAGVAGTWAAPCKWRERACGGVWELAVWAAVERPEQSKPMGMSR
jgi:hypothetical protein